LSCAIATPGFAQQPPQRGLQLPQSMRQSAPQAGQPAQGGQQAPMTPQEAAIDHGMTIYKENCSICHGWQGMGAFSGEELGITGVPLVTSQLNAEQMVETVTCGRPDTGMPQFYQKAWTQERPCYGNMLLADIPKNARPTPPYKRLLDPKEIADVVTYIQADYVGKQMTLDLCQKLNGTSSVCDQYKK
jgi:mono/diheme cytochrome c family protein